MSEFITAFLFTEKAKNILGDVQGNVYIESAAIIIVFTYLFYSAFRLIAKKEKYVGSLIIFIIFLLIIFSNAAKESFARRQLLQNEYAILLDVYQNQKYEVAEGTVRVLHLEPDGGHAAGDIIKIGDVEFEFSCYHHTFGYSKTIVFGGILTEGIFARVYYYQTSDFSSRGKIILRIDLLEKPSIPIKKIDPILPCAG